MPKEPMLIDNITVNDSGDGHGERRPGLFTDILKNSPGSAASLLKRFHKQKHSKRFHLAAEIAACGYEAQSESSPNPNDQMDKFLSSKLPVVLIEIASESSLYKWWGEDDDITVYASNIISALAGCVGYLQKLHWSYHAHYTDLPCLRELVDASEKLWTTLWNKRKLLFPFPEEIDAMGSEPVVHPGCLSHPLVRMARFLNHVKSRHTMGPHNSDGSPAYVTHLGHLMFYIWLSAPIGEGLNALATFVSHLDESIIDHEDLFNTALVEDNRVEDFADAIGFLFMEDNCDPEGRFSLLLVHHCAVHFCKEFTELEKERFEDGRITAMHRVGYMCQRLFCMPDSDDLVAEIVKGLYIVRDTIHMGDISPESVGPFFEELQYFEITAKVYALCAAQGHHEHIDLLINVAQSYMAVHHFYLQKTRDLEAAHSMKRAVSRLWRPILEELQSMPLDDEGLVARAKESWVRFGSCAGLRPEKYDPIEEEAISMHEARHVPYKRCQWRDCYCTYHQPEHSMRVCKGCWKSRYCSKKCQKSDWRLGGHRTWCHPRTSS